MSLTTYCHDSPQNWAAFNQLKDRLNNPHRSRHRRTPAESLNQALQQQISRENRMLRSLRSYLPGREPDRYVL